MINKFISTSENKQTKGLSTQVPQLSMCQPP